MHAARLASQNTAFSTNKNIIYQNESNRYTLGYCPCLSLTVSRKYYVPLIPYLHLPTYFLFSWLKIILHLQLLNHPMLMWLFTLSMIIISSSYKFTLVNPCKYYFLSLQLLIIYSTLCLAVRVNIIYICYSNRLQVPVGIVIFSSTSSLFQLYPQRRRSLEKEMCLFHSYP